MTRILSAFLFLLIVGCAANTGVPVISGEAYYPLIPGSFVELEVSRTTYSNSASVQKTQYQFRQVIGSPYPSASGEFIFPIQYLTRKTDQDNWKIDSISSVSILNDKLLLVENGRTIIKFSFPLTERNFWNANAYNVLDEQFFEIRNVGKPMQVGSHFFPKTVTLIRQNDSTRLSQKKHIEVYAENVGLIRREIAFLNFCYGVSCTGISQVSSGWTETSIIKNYGR